MKAVAVYPQRKEVRLIEHEEPAISQGQQVKLRMLEVGVCGTDKEICISGFGSPPQGFDYLVLGHEALGEVVEVGADVHHLQPGDLVVPIVRHPCSHSECRACQAGRQDYCLTDEYTERGIKQAHGYMTDLVVDDEQYMYRVPPALRQVAVLTEPLTIAEKALEQVVAIQSRLPWFSAGETPGRGLKALVLGSGPIGILGTMLLLNAGFDTYVYSRSQVPNPKADIVTALGASYFSSEAGAVEQLIQRVGKFDLVYEALGAAPVVFEAIQALGPTGVFVFTGVPEGGETASIDTGRLIQHLVMHNQIIAGTVNTNPACFASAISHLEIFQQRWPRELQALIRRYPVENFQDVLLGKVGGIKNVITLE